MANSNLKELNDGGFNNLLLIAVFVVVVYLFVNGFTKSKKQTYLENAGTDLNTQQAQALRDAMNRSGYGPLMGMDGTDLDLIISTAGKITDYKKVADAYRVLYGSELTTDLSNELNRTDLQKFWNIVYKTPGSTNVPSTGTATTSLIGKTVTAKEKVNLRIFQDPEYVDYQAEKGEVVGTYLGEKNLTLKALGKTVTFLMVRQSKIFGLYDVDYYVSKASVTIG
jgi:hypothetical protein